MGDDLSRGLMGGGTVNPAELPPEGRADRAVTSTGDLEAKQHMVSDVGEKLDRAQELVIGPETRVELRALVAHHAVGAVG